MRTPRAIIAVVSMGWTAALSAATAVDRVKTIALLTSTGEHLDLGRVTFTPEGDGATSKLDLNSAELKPEFLSMRPFNGLHDPKEW